MRTTGVGGECGEGVRREPWPVVRDPWFVAREKLNTRARKLHDWKKQEEIFVGAEACLQASRLRAHSKTWFGHGPG